MLLFFQLSSLEKLWEDFHQHICDDLHIHIVNPTPECIYDYRLYLIGQTLSDSGYSLKNFLHMPLPLENWTAIMDNPFISDQLCYNADEEHELFLQHMENVQCIPEQLDAYNCIV